MLKALLPCVGGAVMVSALGLVSSGCSTPTTVTGEWRDTSYTAGPMRNLLVFGGGMSEGNRRTLEDGFVSALATRGVHAMASYLMFPGSLPSNDEARAAAQRQGIDGVLVASERGINERTTIVPGSYGDGFWGGYYAGWAGGWTPGYATTDQFVKFETSVWDANQGKLVWSSTTQTENPTSSTDFVKSLTKEVLPAMTQSGILPPKGNAISSVAFRRVE
jgi:hypothetical protein